MTVLAIDPGTTESAYVVWDGEIEELKEFGKVDNLELLQIIGRYTYVNILDCNSFCIEKIASYGMAVGQTTFDTCVWSGRFIQQWINNSTSFSEKPIEVFRKDVKMHLCGQTRAKDSNIIQALKDRFEPDLKPRQRPKGILKGLKADIWQAFALAVYYHDINF